MDSDIPFVPMKTDTTVLELLMFFVPSIMFLAIRDRISFHGVAVNISGEVLKGFAKINPCGLKPDTIGFVAVERDKLRDVMRMNFENRLHAFKEVNRNFFDGLGT